MSTKNTGGHVENALALYLELNAAACAVVALRSGAPNPYGRDLADFRRTVGWMGQRYVNSDVDTWERHADNDERRAVQSLLRDYRESRDALKAHLLAEV